MKKLFLTSGIVVCMASSAFATDPTGITATNGVAQPATCDTDTLETSTGPVQLRADFTP